MSARAGVPPRAAAGAAPHPGAAEAAEAAEVVDARGAAAIERAVRRLGGVPLEAVGTASLLDRVDVKFLLPAALVPALLRECAGPYRALEVGGRRLCRYRTQYYDTADLALYHAHHAGRLPRHKVRVRAYQDTGQRFLEVKRKTNAGRTTKARVPLPPGDAPPLGDEATRAFLREVAPAPPPEALRETAGVAYTRLTLVRGAAGEPPDERVTIDVGLELSHGGATVAYPALAIAEVKRAGRVPSPFLDALRRRRVRPASVSKYCLAVAALHDSAKRNRYLPLLRRVRAQGRFAPGHVP